MWQLSIWKIAFPPFLPPQSAHQSNLHSICCRIGITRWGKLSQVTFKCHKLPQWDIIRDKCDKIVLIWHIIEKLLHFVCLLIKMGIASQMANCCSRHCMRQHQQTHQTIEIDNNASMILAHLIELNLMPKHSLRSTWMAGDTTMYTIIIRR